MTTSAIAFIAIAAPALADVTPAEVWQSWVDYYKANGYQVTEGSREEAGSNLTLKDVTFGMTAAEEGQVNVRIPQITLDGTGDGKVRTVMSDAFSGTGTFKDDEGGAVDIAFSATMPGNETVSSGTLQDMTHEGKMPQLTLTLDSIKGAKAVMEKPLTLKLTNAVMSQHNVIGDALKVTSSGTVEKMEVNGTIRNTAPDADAADLDETVNFALTIDGITGSGDATLPEGVDLSRDPNAAMKAGFAANGQGSMQKLALSGDFAGKDDEGADESGTFKMSADGLSLSGGMSQAGLTYQGDMDATAVEVTSSGMPFPITYGTQSSSFDIQIPVMKSDSAVPFKFAYSIGGLTMGDAIWDLFDSAKALPRDPANLDIDVTGMTKVLMDVFDPANMTTADGADVTSDDAATTGTATGDTTTPPAATAAPEGTGGASPSVASPSADTATTGTDTAGTDTAGTDTAGSDTAADADDSAEEEPMPFEPTEISINKIALSAAGARLDASGDLTVPEGGSMEAPVGKIDTTMEGVNGLIDKLVTAGLVPQEQVASLRMMLAMFAKPAPEGGDNLVSEIEFRDGGQIFANGQQVK